MQVGIPVFGRSFGSLEPLMSDYAAGYGSVGGEGPDAVQFLGGYSCDDKAGLKRERDLRRKIFTVAGVEARQEDGQDDRRRREMLGGIVDVAASLTRWGLGSVETDDGTISDDEGKAGWMGGYGDQGPKGE